MATSEKTMRESKNQARQGIQSLEIGVELFQKLHQLHRPATLSELAKLSHMPPAKVHRYCVSLIRTGLMQQDGRGRYSIGPYGFQLGHAGANLENAISLTSKILPLLVKKIGETAFISRWGQTGPCILKVEDAPKPLAIRPNWRGDLPLWNSATGRAFAAFLPPERLEPLIASELQIKKREEKLSAQAVATRRALFNKHLADVRKRKLARSTGERYPGLISFAAPIFDRDGAVILALTSFSLSLSPSWEGAVPQALKAAALDLTHRIGGAVPA